MLRPPQLTTVIELQSPWTKWTQSGLPLFAGFEFIDDSIELGFSRHKTEPGIRHTPPTTPTKWRRKLPAGQISASGDAGWQIIDLAKTGFAFHASLVVAPSETAHMPAR